MFDLRLLGPPGIFRDGEPVRLLKKSLALLAFLAMEPGKPHERGFLSELLWPELPKSRADNSLRWALHSLRKIFDIPGTPLLSATRTHVGLTPGPILRIDAHGLLRPPASCPFFHDPEDCPECRARMSGALRDIRGPFLEGFSLPDCEEFGNWMTATREELLVRIRGSVNRLVRLYEKTGKIEETLSLLDGALRMDPLDEACHGRRMLLLAESGNTLAALHQFEACRKILREQLGAEPALETRAIVEKIRSSAPGKRTPLPVERGPVFPDLAFFPEWRPATALHVEFSEGGAEEAGELSTEIGSLLVRAASKAEELGGTLGRLQERSFLCWFGTSGWTEGAARRAARAALEIRGLVLGGPGEKSRGIAFAAGIHSGRILRGDPTAPPDPTGSVSRSAMALSMQAEPGSILLSEPASRLLQGQFRLDEAGEIRVLGQRAKGFLLRGLSGEIARPEDSVLLFGREREIGVLKKLWEQEQCGVLVVEGEAGIGKSALVRGFLDFAMAREALVRRIECDPQTADSPFFPVVRTVREPAGVPEGMDPETAYARLLSYVQSFSLQEEKTAVALLGRFFSLPPHPAFPLPDFPPSALREETSKILFSILRFRALEGRAIYLVEDLHWADASTGDLLRRVLSDSFFTGKIFFLLTTRTGEDPPWLSSIAGAKTIRLSSLREKDSRRMIRSLCSDAPLSDGEISRILAAADGVPLFIEELTRERIEQREGPSPGPSPTVPSTLSEVLASRLDRLGEARLLLQRASVYGRSVPLDLLRFLSPEAPDFFDRLLERAVLSGLVGREADPSGELFSFRHALIAEAALASLPAPSRKLLHQQIGETIRNRFPERAAATPELVARHFEGAEDWPLAVEWYGKAGETAFSKGFLSETELLLRSAIRILPRCAPAPGVRTAEIRLRLLLGKVLLDLYGMGIPEAGEAFRKALSLVESGTTVSEEAFYALYCCWESLYGGIDLRESRRVADSLLLMAGNSGNANFRIASLYADGSTAFYEGRFVRSKASVEECIALSETSGKDTGMIVWGKGIVQTALDYRVWNFWYSGRYRSARGALDSRLALASETLQKKGHILTFAAMMFRYFRFPDRVLAVVDLLLDFLRSANTEIWSCSEIGFRGWAIVQQGDPAGIPMILRSVFLSRRCHNIARVQYLALLSDAYLALGRFREARGVADSALHFSEKSGTFFFDAELWRLKGEAALLDARREEARECFGTALEIGRRQGARALELRTATSLGRFLGDAGKRKEALALFSGLSELLDGPESDPSLPDIRDALETRTQLS